MGDETPVTAANNTAFLAAAQRAEEMRESIDMQEAASPDPAVSDAALVRIQQELDRQLQESRARSANQRGRALLEMLEQPLAARHMDQETRSQVAALRTLSQHAQMAITNQAPLQSTSPRAADAIATMREMMQIWPEMLSIEQVARILELPTPAATPAVSVAPNALTLVTSPSEPNVVQLHQDASGRYFDRDGRIWLQNANNEFELAADVANRVQATPPAQRAALVNNEWGSHLSHQDQVDALQFAMMSRDAARHRVQVPRQATFDDAVNSLARGYLTPPYPAGDDRAAARRTGMFPESNVPRGNVPRDNDDRDRQAFYNEMLGEAWNTPGVADIASQGGTASRSGPVLQGIRLPRSKAAHSSADLYVFQRNPQTYDVGLQAVLDAIRQVANTMRPHEGAYSSGYSLDDLQFVVNFATPGSETTSRCFSVQMLRPFRLQYQLRQTLDPATLSVSWTVIGGEELPAVALEPAPPPLNISAAVRRAVQPASAFEERSRVIDLGDD